MKRYFATLCALLFIAASVYSQEQKVSLLFAGDAMQHQRQLDAAKTKTGYDYSSYYQHIKDEVSAVDIAVVNLETTLPGKNYTGYPKFGSPDSFAFALKDAGFDIFLTANNHSADKGKLGIERTLDILDSIGVKHLGTYKDQKHKDNSYPLLVVKNGIRIAMLNYSYDTNGMPVPAPNIVNLINKKQILRDIELCKIMKADIIVANMHWGEEYKLKNNKTQAGLAQFLIDNGVQLVIGGHPHVVQPIDIRKAGDSIENIVVYSMGNLVSGMRVVNTDGGMMVKIEISKESEDAPVKIDNCSYSLVFVHKPVENGRAMYQLIPVEKYNNEEGKAFMGAEAFGKMEVFYKNAKAAVESLWNKQN
ncbi:CapA family protein [Dysgonomonas sp. 520]|uniref:CapA family protein n=1 Tax=Dysgonomonas sp. 520 TaxID=2302931 RepID=UPI0013D0CE71|nr:CapA family protein [Dysgonomonas sp. 520]NDW08382.1 CapA family protein [Dysgonomonas sp. 520]